MDETTYSSIVVPSVLEKLPENLRLTITRAEDYRNWSLKDLLQRLVVEVELQRRCHDE